MNRDEEMKIVYLLVKGLAGGDVYFDRVSRVMNKLNIETKIKYYPHILEMTHFFISLGPCDIIHCKMECGTKLKV